MTDNPGEENARAGLHCQLQIEHWTCPRLGSWTRRFSNENRKSVAPCRVLSHCSETTVTSLTPAPFDPAAHRPSGEMVLGVKNGPHPAVGDLPADDIALRGQHDAASSELSKPSARSAQSQRQSF
jgi:hypothetical protein